MKNFFKKPLNEAALIAIAVVIGAGIVYAATTYSAAGGGAVTTITTNWSDCRKITNNNGPALFVPANTTAEWTSFLNNAPGKTVASCCVCNTCQSPPASVWYDDYFIYNFGGDSSCSGGGSGESGTVTGEYWTVVEPANAALTNSIDTGNSCFYFNWDGAYAKAYSRSPIYDNGGSWYYGNCGVCGQSC